MTEQHYLKNELDEHIKTNSSTWLFIAQSALDGFWYRDLENPENEWVSSKFWENLGYDVEEKKHLSSEWQDITFKEDLEVEASNLKKHIADSRHSYDQIMRYRRKDGGISLFRRQGIIIQDAEGNPTRLFGVHTDLTDQSLKVEDLTGRNTLLNSVLDSTQNGIIGLDADGRVMIVNLTARHMLGGITIDPPFNWPEAVQFLDPDTLKPLSSSSDPITRSLSGMSLKGETTLMSRHKKDSEPRYTRLTSSILTDDIKAETGIDIVLVIEDISELEMNRQQVERASRLDALGQLTGGIAHDFNNILATIQYSIQLLSMKTADERSKNYLRTVQTSITRGSQLTQRLLAFANRQPGLAESSLVGDVMDEFAGLATPVIEEAIEMNINPCLDDLWVFCDIGQLENALLNLVLNSRDAIMRSSKGNQISLTARAVAELDADATLRRENTQSYIMRGLNTQDELSRLKDKDVGYRYVEFAVTDNGPGMSEEVRRRAVDPFFTTKSTNSGTGLGLSMVYGFVQQAGGELRIYSEDGIGTTVRLLIPRGAPGGKREEPVKRLPEPSGQQQRILIVEDEFGLLSAMTEIVESFGYVVMQAINGVEAIEVLEKNPEIDLLLTDVVMPGGVSGFELAQKFRLKLPNLPVIYMSGYAGFTEEQIGDVKAPLIQKPAPPAELAEAIQTALSTPIK